MTDWKSIKMELGKTTPPCPPDHADVFWADFKARARMTRQEAAKSQAHPFMWTSMALAGTAAILMMIFGFPGRTLAATEVTSLEIEAPHSSAIILNVVSESGKEAGALVWISGLEETP